MEAQAGYEPITWRDLAAEHVTFAINRIPFANGAMPVLSSSGAVAMKIVRLVATSRARISSQRIDALGREHACRF